MVSRADQKVSGPVHLVACQLVVDMVPERRLGYLDTEPDMRPVQDNQEQQICIQAERRELIVGIAQKGSQLLEEGWLVRQAWQTNDHVSKV